MLTENRPPPEQAALHSLQQAFLLIADDDQRRRLEQKATTREDVEQAIVDLHDALKEFKDITKVEHALRKISDLLDHIDPLISSAAGSNQTASTVWGAVKVLLTVAKGRQDVVEAMVDSIICIADNLPRICSFDDIYSRSHGSRNAATSAAFCEITTFLGKLAEYVRRNRGRQLISFKLSSEIRDAKRVLVDAFRDVFYEQCAMAFKEAATYRTDEKYNRLRKRLDAVNYEDDLATRRDRRYSDTCAWTLSNDALRTWFSDDFESAQSCRLWLHGGPGTGKSILAAYLVDYVSMQASPDEAVVYFFCDSKDNSKRTSDTIVRALMVQLLETKSAYWQDYHLLRDDILKRGRSYKFSVRELEKYLTSLTKSFTKTRFIIDGLDECEREVLEDQGVIAMLDRLVNSSDCRTKILLFGRAEKQVQERLSSWPQLEIGGTGTTQDDMRTYVSRKVDELTGHIPYLVGRREALQEQLLRASGAMFLFARLLVQDLIENKDLPRNDIESMLNRPPHDLNCMYAQYLDNLARKNNSARVRQIGCQVLQWLVYSDGPISLTLLDATLAISPEDDRMHPDKRLGDVQAVIQRALGILVEYRQALDSSWRASLVHQSFKDYLTDVDHGDLNAAPTYSLNIRSMLQSHVAHFHLLRTCCIVLCSPTIREPFMEYLDAVDMRRSELTRPVRQDLLTLYRSKCMTLFGDSMGEWGQRKDWKYWRPEWEEAQRRVLMQIWQDRTHRTRHAMQGIQDAKQLNESQRRVLATMLQDWEDQLATVRRLQDQKQQELDQLDTLLRLDEREAMAYSQRRLSHHLAGAISHHSTHIPAVAALLIVTCSFIQDALHAIRALSHVVGTQTPQKTTEVAAFLQLTACLRCLPDVLSEVIVYLEQFSTDIPYPSADEQRRNGRLSDIFDSAYSHPWCQRIRTFCTGLISNPTQLYIVFHDDVIRAGQSCITYPGGRHGVESLLNTMQQAIAVARAAEYALHSYDDTYTERNLAFVGSSRVAYHMQGLSHSLARLTLLFLSTSSQDDQRSKLLTLLEDDDFFMCHILHPMDETETQLKLPRGDERNSHGYSQSRGSIKPGIRAYSAFVSGYILPLPIWVLASLVTYTMHKRQYNPIPDQLPLWHSTHLELMVPAIWGACCGTSQLIFGFPPFTMIVTLAVVHAMACIIVPVSVCFETAEQCHHILWRASGLTTDRVVATIRIGFSRDGDFSIGGKARFKTLQTGIIVRSYLTHHASIKNTLSRSLMTRYPILTVIVLALVCLLHSSLQKAINAMAMFLLMNEAIARIVDPDGIIRAQINLQWTRDLNLDPTFDKSLCARIERLRRKHKGIMERGESNVNAPSSHTTA